MRVAKENGLLARNCAPRIEGFVTPQTGTFTRGSKTLFIKKNIYKRMQPKKIFTRMVGFQNSAAMVSC